MALGKLETEADLQRAVERLLYEKHGIVPFHRIAGSLGAGQLPSPVPFPELDADPDPPDTGCIVYCIDDNGAAKRELRALFPTGSPVAVATEP